MAARGGGGEPRVGGQAEVVVRAEVDEGFAINLDMGGLGAGAFGEVTPEACAIEVGEFVVEPVQRMMVEGMHAVDVGNVTFLLSRGLIVVVGKSITRQFDKPSPGRNNEPGTGFCGLLPVTGPAGTGGNFCRTPFVL